MAEEAHGELGAAGAHQSREADDLALADLQVDVLDEVTLRILGVIDVPVLDLEDDIADGAVLDGGVHPHLQLGVGGGGGDSHRDARVVQQAHVYPLLPLAVRL